MHDPRKNAKQTPRRKVPTRQSPKLDLRFDLERTWAPNRVATLSALRVALGLSRKLPQVTEEVRH